MGARYYCKRINDAVYRGKKTPSQEELDAMAYEVTRLRKKLSSVAKRYAFNIRVAKRMAVSFMNEEERTMLAEALSFLFATPAHAAAFNLSSLNGIEAGLNSIAGGTPDISMSAAEIDRRRKERIEKEKAHKAAMKQQLEKESQNPELRRQQIKSRMEHAQREADFYGTTVSWVARAGEVAAAGTTLVAGAALFALTVPAALTAGSTAAGLFTVTVGMVGGGLSTVDSALGFVDTVTDKEDRSSGRKGLKKAVVAVNTVNVVKGALTVTSAVEGLSALTDAVGLAQSYEDMLDACEDPKAPGREGVKAVKYAANNADDAKRGNRDSGGGSGDCGCGS